MGFVHSPIRHILESAFVFCCFYGVVPAIDSSARAQESAIVAVDDSPAAEQMLSQAEDQAANNATESARLISRVLDEFGRKLVRVQGKSDRFVDGRSRAESFLRSHPQVLLRFRSAQSGEADRLASASEDRRLIETRLLTTAGLFAAVREVQREVELAQFVSAKDLLDSIENHPDIASVTPSILATLTVLTAWGNGDEAIISSTLQTLANSQDAELRHLAERLTITVKDRMSAVNHTINPLAPTRFGPIPAHAVRLWSEPLENSIYSRLQDSIEAGALPASSSEGSAASGRFLVSIPTVDGALVLVNEGYVLRAYDAYSHLPKWDQFIGAPNAPRTDMQAGDLEVVVVASDCVLALSGHALGSERTGGGRLVCLDLGTGRRRWELAPDRLGDQAEFRDLFFYGAPTVVHNTVVLLGRKVTPRLETVSTVMGVNLQSGAVEWITPVGAAPGVRTAGARPYTTPVAENGRVFISTGAGTSACIDAIDGRIRWIRRDPVPIRDLQLELMPWEMSGAVVTPRGLLTLAPGGTQLQLLAIDSGEEIDSFPVGNATEWGAVRYLLTDRDHSLIYGVGDGIVAFAIADLRTPRWKFTGIPGDDAMIPLPSRSGIRGRVQSGTLENGRSGLIVPLVPQALLLNGDDGTTILTIPCQGPANIVARDGVIAAATNDSLEVLMDAARAQQILLSALEERPQDADAVIGLVEFALQAHDATLLRAATKAIEPAIEAVRNSPERRMRFVGMLIAAARSGLLGRDGSDALFAAIVHAHANPAERAMALVAQGDWLAESGRVAGAIAAWRELLNDPEAARATVPDSQGDTQFVSRTGADAALQRLERMAATPGLPAESTRSAENSPTGGSAAELERFASRLPFTAVAARAWSQASQLRMDEKALAISVGDAAAALDTAIASGNRAVVTEILDRAIVLMRKSDLEITAAQLLDSAVIAGFDVPLASLGGIDASHALLASTAAQLVEDLPRPLAAAEVMTPQSEVTAHLIRGVLAPIRNVGASLSPNGRSYLVVDRSLACLAVPDLAPRWSVALRGEISRVVPLRDGVLVIEQPNREALAAEWIDDGGESRWRIDDLAQAVSLNGGGGAERTECIVLATHQNLDVVRADGVVCAFALVDGRPIWRTVSTIDDVASADASETLVVVAGTRNKSDGSTSWVVALDQSSGKILAQLEVPNDEPIRWVQVMSPGEIAFGTARGVGRWQLFGCGSGMRWLSLNPRLRGTVHGERLATKLVVAEATDRTNVLDWRSGLIEDGRFGMSTKNLSGDGSRKWLRSGTVIVGWSNNGVELFTLAGEAIGSSSLHGTRKIQEVFAASGALVAVEQSIGSNEPRETNLARVGARTLIHRFGWNDGGRIVGVALEAEFTEGRLDRMQLLDGWILLSGPQSTLAIPLP